MEHASPNVRNKGKREVRSRENGMIYFRYQEPLLETFDSWLPYFPESPPKIWDVDDDEEYLFDLPTRQRAAEILCRLVNSCCQMAKTPIPVLGYGRQEDYRERWGSQLICSLTAWGPRQRSRFIQWRKSFVSVSVVSSPMRSLRGRSASQPESFQWYSLDNPESRCNLIKSLNAPVRHKHQRKALLTP